MSASCENLVANWLLVQLNTGCRDVVHVNSVVNPVDKELKNGETLTVTIKGEMEPATLIAHAQERNMLEAMIVKAEATAGPSRQVKEEEEGEDFSSGDSEWVPSDNDDQSCDSDAEVNDKKIKSERCKRQYSRSNKRVLTPSNRANAVPVNTDNEKKTCNETMNQCKPDSSKFGVTVSLQTLRAQVRDFNDTFMMLFTMFFNFKEQKLAAVNAGTTEHTPPVMPNLNVDDGSNGSTSQSNESEKGYNENDNNSNPNEEFNRSNDNVLITNKYSNVDVETVERNDAAEREWIPIGSGKTLIHKDKYKKVNWKSYTIATRTLLIAAFPRRILATHSLTGKVSPAFQYKPPKMCLDQKIVCDIIWEVTERFNVKENLVRNIITTKCADECKMWKMRNQKNTASKIKKESEAVQSAQ